jgi:hypothetical protein
VIADHRIGGRIVVPATVALGLLIGAAERRWPESPVTEVHDFAVHKGIVFDASAPEAVTVEVSKVEGDGVTAALRTADSTARPLFSAVLRAGGRAAATPSMVLPRPDAPEWRDGAELYHDGTLFHGPLLRGIERFHTEDRSGLVLACRLDAADLPVEDHAGARYQPLQSDLLLQAALVRVRLTRGTASLPVGVARMQLWQPLPVGETFFVVVDDMTDTAGTTTCRVTACDGTGRVFTRWEGVAVVTTEALDGQFAHQ